MLCLCQAPTHAYSRSYHHATQIGSLYLNGADALAPPPKDPATSSTFAASTLHACRQQLAEDGADPEAWLAQQVAARSCVEVTYGIQVGLRTDSPRVPPGPNLQSMRGGPCDATCGFAVGLKASVVFQLTLQRLALPLGRKPCKSHPGGRECSCR